LCELAASLCFLGCVALPDEVFERAYSGQDLSPDEDQMFRAHPESAARLVSNIPRLEVVAEIILRQQANEENPPVLEASRPGARMLHLALELDRRIYRGIPARLALDEIKSAKRFDMQMLDALKGYSPERAEFEARRLAVRDLRAGMVLEQDVRSKDGNLLILKHGTLLNETWIERLENFTKAPGAQDLISVRVPRLPGARSLEELGYGIARSESSKPG
jgi:HD domain